MSMHKTATIGDVCRAVLSSNGGAQLSAVRTSVAVDLALRSVIGLNCLGGATVDIDLGNGHLLHCSVRRAVGQEAAHQPDAISLDVEAA